MLVYRLEIPIEIGHRIQLIGPWTAAVWRKDLESLTWRYKDTLPGPIPEPQEDGISGFNSAYVCGWSTLRGFMTWSRWKDVTDGLLVAGFKLSQYEVPDKEVKVGKTQVCWSPVDATFVRHMDYDECFDLLESTVNLRHG